MSSYFSTLWFSLFSFEISQNKKVVFLLRATMIYHIPYIEIWYESEYRDEQQYLFYKILKLFFINLHLKLRDEFLHFL